MFVFTGGKPMRQIIGEVIYQAFGLMIKSDIVLPELLTMKATDFPVDVSITYADLSQLWSKHSTSHQRFVVDDNLLMFAVPHVAIYLVKDGQEIFVSPIVDANEDQIRLFLLGTCMGAILLQRRILPLHGSAIAIDDKAYAIIGDSGAGKSTLASALLAEGHQLISDDVIPVTLAKEHIPTVTPAYPQQKLWLKSLNEFGMSSTSLKPIIDREEKFAVPVLNNFSTEPMELVGVFELVKTNTNKIRISSVQNLERLHILFNHTYRNFLIKRWGLLAWHFQVTAKILNHIELYQIERPISKFTAQELASLILKISKKGEKVR